MASLKTRRWAIGAAGTALAVAGAGYWLQRRGDGDFLEPPFSVPFDPSVAGSKVSVRFRLAEYQGLNLGLTFRSVDRRPMGLRDRLLLGGTPLVDGNGRESSMEVAGLVVIRLAAVRPSTLESDYKATKTSLRMSGFTEEETTFTLDRVRLRAGTYVLGVESAAAIVSRASASVSLVVFPNPKSTSIDD